MTPDRRCPARSRLNGAQCTRLAGHPGEHSAAASEISEIEDPRQLWIVPGGDTPASLEELLGHLQDLIVLCRAEGYGGMADALTVVRSRIELNPSGFQRHSARLSDLPPLE